MDLIEQIDELFARHGGSAYEGRREEPVTALAHALQCAQLAEWAHAPAGLVAAALLHDIGHFVPAAPGTDLVDDVHELRALGLLAGGFGREVLEPIRLHVAAKRYLVATDPLYAATLSPASVHTLALQGGPMSPDEVWMFRKLPGADEALQLRRWDDQAKQPGKRTPPLDYYLGLLDEVRRQPEGDRRQRLGCFGVT
ncbi:HD domain-containing protein [Ideonella sp. A 288]|uniref:HD domain-containing protein n=1 Tax=Ideonella sp. A 288 TaxID=1962181 RepID=UPI000B4B9502|nr:phosphohydrolase [Ideonella sp. A 288]